MYSQTAHCGEDVRLLMCVARPVCQNMMVIACSVVSSQLDAGIL